MNKDSKQIIPELTVHIIGGGGGGGGVGSATLICMGV